MKVTPQRLVIFQILLKNKKHPDVESIFREVRKKFPEMSLATVYSTLRRLQKTGLIQEIGTFGEVRRFDGRLEPHPHLICINCKRIEDLDKIDKKDIKKLESSIIKKTKYELVKSCFSLYGYCPDCKYKIKKDRFKFERKKTDRMV
jgi:Fur family peroxide stress response transcriptional regulator